MILNTKDFYDTLKQLEPAIASKEIIDGATDIIFYDNKIFTFNDQILCLVPFDHNLNIAIPAIVDDGSKRTNSDGFVKFISKLKSKEIELTQNENQINVRAGNIDVDLNIRNDVEVMNIVEKLDIPEKFKSLPSDFLEGIKKCQKNLLNISENIDSQNYIVINQNEILTANRKCIGYYKMDSFIDEILMILPEVCKKMSNYNIVFYATNNAWVFFKDEADFIFAYRKFNGEHENIINSKEYYEFDGINIKMPDFSEIVEIGNIFSELNINKIFGFMIDIIIEDSKLFVESKNSKGKFKAEFDIGIDGNYELKLPIDSLRQISGKEIKIDNDLTRILVKEDNCKFLAAISK